MFSIYEVYLNLILAVKILYLIVIILRIKSQKNKKCKQEKKYEKLETFMHNLFLFLVSLLLLYLFRPTLRRSVTIDGETKLYLFIFGGLTLLSLAKKFIKVNHISVSNKEESHITVSFDYITEIVKIFSK
jgi:uncharacterized protein YhhL (DUF1145 family)